MIKKNTAKGNIKIDIYGLNTKLKKSNVSNIFEVH